MTAPCEPVTKCHKNNGKQLWLPGIADTASMVAESIDYLREHEPQEGYYVGFSGGKDSIVTLELCRMAGVKHQAFYSCTRIDPPEVVRFIRQEYPDVTFLFGSMTMWDGVKTKMPPLGIYKWCCDVLKKHPAASIPLMSRVMGIRAEESTLRSMRPRNDMWNKFNVYKPVFAWKEWHVWDFIDSNGLKYPCLYDEGFDRIGCIVCPTIFRGSRNATAKRQQSMDRWPGVWKAFEHACRHWFENKLADKVAANGESGVVHKDFDSYYAAYLRGFE